MTNTNFSQTEELRAQHYFLRREIEQFQRLIDNTRDLAEATEHLKTLQASHEQLATLEHKLAEAGTLHSGKERPETPSPHRPIMRGADTTGIEVYLHLHLPQIPTAICHLLNGDTHPLLCLTITNTSSAKRRLRVESFVENYSARAVSTLEISPKVTERVCQLPTFFPEPLRTVTELTRATLNVIVEDMDRKRVELHESTPVWLLARNSAPLRIRDLKTGTWQDMRPFLACFVTPHEPSILAFLRTVAARHPDGRLEGYYASAHTRSVKSQVRAIYDGLKEEIGLAYVSSFIDFNPNLDSVSQRVRLPRESLESRQANCLDGALLFASLLEAISLQPALVYVPGHMMVAWRTHPSEGRWSFLDSTRMSFCTFDEAVEWGHRFNDEFAGNNTDYRFMPIAELRAKNGITPLE